jgi:type I restriction enzyme, R subunit
VASLDFLRELLELAREEGGKAALTELFESAKDEDTPVMVERIVNEIDDVVRAVRFDG